MDLSGAVLPRLRRASIEDRTCAFEIPAPPAPFWSNRHRSQRHGDRTEHLRARGHSLGAPCRRGSASAGCELKKDRSSVGLRDYAILTLLATYGLRAGEIVRLRLDDIEWRREVLRVRHSKTGTHSELPLLREPGEALLRYLERARPPSSHREVFLRVHAPHRPFKCGSNLNCVTGARLRAAGISPQGRKGPHAFRHARAVSLAIRERVT